MQNKKPGGRWTRQEIKEYIVTPAIAAAITSVITTLILLRYL